MRYSLGVDIGGTNIRVAIVSEDGEIIKVLKEPTDKSDGKNSLLNQVVRMYKSVTENTNYKLEGIGVGVPGPVNPKNGFVYILPNLNIEEIPVKEYLEEKTGLKVHVGNDANVAGLAEAYVGNGKGYDMVQYLTISTGIGGGLIINKKIIAGNYGFAQEVGSTVVNLDGRKSHNFKPDGCIEILASGSQLVKIANEDFSLNVSHAGEIFELANNGNKSALQIKDEWLENMAAFFGNLVSILEPDIFVVGGGLMKSSAYFLEELIQKVDKYVFEFLRGKIKIVPAKYDQDAGIIGAAMQAF